MPSFLYKTRKTLAKKRFIVYNTLRMINEQSLEKIREDIERYKTADKVTIVAASKTVSSQTISDALRLGITDFGENRANELVCKYAEVPPPVRWHFIGRLQTNKVRLVIDKVALIHSLDSERLLRETDRQARLHGIVMPVLVEVNMGKEPDKGGVFPEYAESLCALCAQFGGVKLKGLMCVFPKGARESLYAEAEALFRRLKAVFKLTELSMGMSGDYVTALKHGATMIRPGTALFGERAAGGER